MSNLVKHKPEIIINNDIVDGFYFKDDYITQEKLTELIELSHEKIENDRRIIAIEEKREEERRFWHIVSRVMFLILSLLIIATVMIGIYKFAMTPI